VACGFRRIIANAWEVHGYGARRAQHGSARSRLTPGVRYSSVRHDLRTSGRRGVAFLVRLGVYLHLRCVQSYIKWQPACGSASAQLTRVHHIDGEPLYSQWRQQVAAERLKGWCVQAIEGEDRAQLLTAEHEAKARKCPQTHSRLMGSRFR